MSAGADASTEREVRSIKMDILNGSLPPDSRLGIIGTAAPLREALSWFAPPALGSAIGKRDFGESASRQDLAENRAPFVPSSSAKRCGSAQPLKRVSPKRRRSVRPQRAVEHARSAGRRLDNVKTVLVETLTKPMRKSWPK
jgi:hypothetical protein